MGGYFGIGVWHPKHECNIGTLLRSALSFGAACVFTVGSRFKMQASDTAKAWRSLPVYNYEDMDDLKDHIPHSCMIICVEQADGAIPLCKFSHPARCLYLLGAEDHGLSDGVIQQCHGLIQIHGARHCLNVAVAGSIVMYDRVSKATLL